jgi:hypothetical protein
VSGQECGLDTIDLAHHNRIAGIAEWRFNCELLAVLHAIYIVEA